MQFSAGGIHAIQRRRDADIICVLGGMGRSRTCYNLLQLVTTCYNLLQLDQHMYIICVLDPGLTGFCVQCSMKHDTFSICISCVVYWCLLVFIGTSSCTSVPDPKHAYSLSLALIRTVCVQ